MGLFAAKEKQKRLPYDAPDYNALLGGIVDRRRGSLYWRVRLKAGAPTPHVIECFNGNVGAPSPYDRSHVLDWSDTNMMAACTLNPPFDIVVERFMFLFQPSCAQRDINAIVGGYFWTYQVLNKYLYREPLVRCSAVGSIDAIVRNFGQPDEIKPESDLSTVLHKIGSSFCFALPGPSYLPPLVEFRVDMQGWPITPEQGMDFYVMIDGLRDYPVQ